MAEEKWRVDGCLSFLVDWFVDRSWLDMKPAEWPGFSPRRNVSYDTPRAGRFRFDTNRDIEVPFAMAINYDQLLEEAEDG